MTGLFDGGPGWLNILSEAPQLEAKYAWIILDAYVTDPTRGNYTMIASSEAKASDGSLSYPSKPHADAFNDWVLVADGH